MIAFLLWSIPFFLLATVVFFLAAKWSLSIRLAIALTIWLLPTAILTLWVLHLGDKPLPGAVTVVPEQSSEDKPR
jgi:hypothetical protein